MNHNGFCPHPLTRKFGTSMSNKDKIKKLNSEKNTYGRIRETILFFKKNKKDRLFLFENNIPDIKKNNGI